MNGTDSDTVIKLSINKRFALVLIPFIGVVMPRRGVRVDKQTLGGVIKR